MSAGLEVDGIVGLATWSSLFEQAAASGASLGGSNIPPQVKQRVEQTLQQAGHELAAQGDSGCRRDRRRPVNDTPPSSAGPRPPRPLTTTPPSADRAAPRRSRARQGHRHVSVRAARRPQPRRHGHRRAHRHAGEGRRVRNGQPGRAAERLRQHRVHHAHEPVLDVLRAPVALRRLERGAGAAGPGDRLRGLHRQLHRAAPPLRDARERAGAEPEHLPVGRLDDPRQAGERSQHERTGTKASSTATRHDAAGLRRRPCSGADSRGRGHDRATATRPRRPRQRRGRRPSPTGDVRRRSRSRPSRSRSRRVRRPQRSRPSRSRSRPRSRRPAEVRRSPSRSRPRSPPGRGRARARRRRRRRCRPPPARGRAEPVAAEAPRRCGAGADQAQADVAATAAVQ